MMLTEAERTKRREEFLVRFAGAMLGGVEDAALEAAWIMNPATHGKFPYTKLHPMLPSSDNLIVGGLAIPPWVIGALMEEDGKKRGDMKAKETGKIVKMVGEGDAIYAFNMNLYHLLTNVLAPTAAGRRIPGKQAASPGAGQRADVGHLIVKL
ncbi:unnamed protein product [marine sediment metagenome]|uniref:Uncharacterized protein n=1 Tax=marine sediment metagenome TaxID=412755 RepID=X1UKJ8_9ZZZZ